MIVTVGDAVGYLRYSVLIETTSLSLVSILLNGLHYTNYFSSGSVPLTLRTRGK